MSSVIILGATGRFGRHATQAFRAAGWRVTTLGRAPGGADHIQADATDPVALSTACKGHDVIVNGLNPAYPDWADVLPRMTRAVIAAAHGSGARVLIPGNVYNYGEDMPSLLRRKTPWRPTTRKGRLRVEMEQAYRAAEVPTLILRAGDFIEREKAGNWFDGYLTPQAHAGKAMYPGPLDQAHAWAYLPDLARAAVMLCEKPDQLERFEEVGFAGFTLTGQQLMDQVSQATGTRLRIRGMPWFVVGLLGWVQPLMREVHEMRYLWRVPHAVCDARLKALLPGFAPTPVDRAIAEALRPL